MVEYLCLEIQRRHFYLGVTTGTFCKPVCPRHVQKCFMCRLQLYKTLLQMRDGYFFDSKFHSCKNRARIQTQFCFVCLYSQ